MASSRTNFWVPAAPPRAHYSVDVKYVPESSRLEGTETIGFRNDTGRARRASPAGELNQAAEQVNLSTEA
jgi:hypothetical protein